MAPDTLDGIRVHEAYLTVHELSRMANRHASIEVVVASPLIGEDKSLRSHCRPHERTENPLAAVGNALQETAPHIARDATEHPLIGERKRFIPFGSSGDTLWEERQDEHTEDAIQSLSRFFIPTEESGNVPSGHACAETEHPRRGHPLVIVQMTPAANRIRPADERTPAVRALKTCSPTGIEAVPMRTGSTAEAAENPSCRLTHGDLGKREPKAILSSHTDLVGYPSVSW